MSAVTARLAMLGLALGLVACAAGGAPAPGPGAPPLGPAVSPPKTAAAPSAAALPPALQAVVDGARREGSLQLVWSQAVLGGSEGARELQDLINQKYGLNLTFEFTPGPAGPAIASRLLQEVSAGQPAHTDVHAISVYADVKDAFASIDWRDYVPELPEDVMYFDRRAVAWGTLVPGITYNSQLVAPDRVPRSLADLLQPEWKGKIAAPPYVVGRSIYALPEYLGYDKWFGLWRDYTRQVGGLIRCGEADRLLSGEFLAFAIDCGDYEARQRARLGQPLGHVIPTEGAALRYWVAGVPLTAPHPNAARLFLAYLLTREGQDFVWAHDGTDAYRVPGSKIAEVVRHYQDQGVKFLEELPLQQQYPELLDWEKEMLTILQQNQ
jgi:iron(III) transport system substrate-binding protein